MPVIELIEIDRKKFRQQIVTLSDAADVELSKPRGMRTEDGPITKGHGLKTTRRGAQLEELEVFLSAILDVLQEAGRVDLVAKMPLKERQQRLRKRNG